MAELTKAEPRQIDINGLFEIFKTSKLKPTDILFVKSNNAYVKFDYAAQFEELWERLGFTPIIVTLQTNDSFEIIPEEKMNAMGYFRQKETA